MVLVVLGVEVKVKVKAERWAGAWVVEREVGIVAMAPEVMAMKVQVPVAARAAGALVGVMEVDASVVSMAVATMVVVTKVVEVDMEKPAVVGATEEGRLEAARVVERQDVESAVGL